MSVGQRVTRRRFVIGAGSTAVLAGAAALSGGCEATPSPLRVQRSFGLPSPWSRGSVPLEQVLASRRSRREFTSRALTEREISQLLWATRGVTAAWGGRTSPSAGALYPLELYVLTAEVYGHYLPQGHRLEVLAERDLRREAAAAASSQTAVGEAPLTLVIAAIYARTEKKYGARGRRYVQLEAGHAAQNVLLQAVALGLAAVPIGAFDDRRLVDGLQLSGEHAPLYLIPVGHPASAYV
jgi:SagB-type dehydrogenase family enzyme